MGRVTVEGMSDISVSTWALLRGVALALAVAGLVLLVPPPASATLTDAEQTLAQRIDQARTARGVRALDTRAALVEVARDWAGKLARSGVLRHNPSLTSDVENWQVVGENVGYGPDVRTVHAAFMDSAAHRANVLDRDYTQVGVGVAHRDGRVWVVEVFRRPAR